MPPSGIAVFKNQHKASHLLAFPIREGCVSGIAASSFHSLPHYYENLSRVKNGAKSTPFIILY